MAPRMGFLEPFDHYPSVTSQGGLDETWIYAGSDSSYQPSLISGLNGSGTGLALRMDSEALDYSYKRSFVGGGTQKLSLAFAWRVARLDSGTPEGPALSVLNESGTQQMGFTMNPTGRIALIGEGAAILQLSDAIFNPQQIYRGCLNVDMTNPNATVINMKMGGQTVFENLIGDYQDATDQMMGAIRLHSYSDFSTNADATISDFDDLMPICDEILDLGEVGITMFGPTSDIVKEWSRSAGADNYPNVDEIPHNLDVDYNYSETVGLRDIFGFGDLTRVPDKFWAVSQLTTNRRTDAGARSIQNLLMVDGVEHLSTPQPSLELYGHAWSHMFVNPETLEDFTFNEFNALTGGYNDAA